MSIVILSERNTACVPRMKLRGESEDLSFTPNRSAGLQPGISSLCHPGQREGLWLVLPNRPAR